MRAHTSQHPFSTFVSLAHHGDLSVLHSNIILVDAKSIDPDVSFEIMPIGLP
jgi:hypothetical protein